MIVMFKFVRVVGVACGGYSFGVSWDLIFAIW
jgi:hypothetical protein